MKENTFTVAVESYAVEKAPAEGINVVGLALPFDKVSRNGFTYVTESIEKSFKSLEGKPVLFNHDPEKIVGHVESVEMTPQGLSYKMNVGDDGPYGWVAKKLERGDLKNVSIQCIYDQSESFMSEDGVMNAYISEFLELSVVSIPGFADTTAQVIEKFQSEDSKMSKEKNKEKAPVQTEEQNEDKPEEQKPSQNEEGEEQPDVAETVKALAAEVDNMKKALASMQKKMEEMDTEEEPEKEEPEEADEEDEEKKAEEAIRKDKVTRDSIATSAESKVLSTEDLKNTFMEL